MLPPWFLLLSLCFSKANPTPQGPEVTLGADRAEIVLNGLWRFQPALSGESSGGPEESQWGSFPVPGTMKGDWRVSLPRNPVERGKNAAWESFA